MNARQRRKLVKLVAEQCERAYSWRRDDHGNLIGFMGGPTDEGWYAEETTISRDGRLVATERDERDCDGRGASFRASRVIGFRWYRWGGGWSRGLVTVDAERSQRDYTAEGAGY